jgi:hypothetical protein
METNGVETDVGTGEEAEQEDGLIFRNWITTLRFVHQVDGERPTQKLGDGGHLDRKRPLLTCAAIVPGKVRLPKPGSRGSHWSHTAQKYSYTTERP